MLEWNKVSNYIQAFLFLYPRSEILPSFIVNKEIIVVELNEFKNLSELCAQLTGYYIPC